MISSSLSSSSSWPHHHCHQGITDQCSMVAGWPTAPSFNTSGWWRTSSNQHYHHNTNTNIANNGHQSLSSFHQPNSIIFTEPSSYYCDPWLLMRTWTASSTLQSWSSIIINILIKIMIINIVIMITNDNNNPGEALTNCLKTFTNSKLYRLKI